MPFAVLDSCLGMAFNAQQNEIRFTDPVLPDFIDELEIQNLTLNDFEDRRRLAPVLRGCRA